jgi:hypothetical protein
MADVQGHEGAPTCGQIDRACRLYAAGASHEAFCEAFKGDLQGAGLVLAWHAAVASHKVDVRNAAGYRDLGCLSHMFDDL